MNFCTTCGGAIGEPYKAYAYVGPWCHCPKAAPVPLVHPQVPEWHDLKRQAVKDAESPPGPIVVTPPEQTLTPLAFVFWLRGYFASASAETFTKGDWKRVAAELAKVKP